MLQKFFKLFIPQFHLVVGTLCMPSFCKENQCGPIRPPERGRGSTKTGGGDREVGSPVGCTNLRPAVPEIQAEAF